MVESFLGGKVELHGGDCREAIRTLADSSVDSVVTDPPYALTSGNPSVDWSAYNSPKGTTNSAGRGHNRKSSRGFMGKQWDNGEAAFAVEFWAEVFRVLKPGGHVVAFSGTRTYHRLACAIEDAGFEIRDQFAWMYGSGFPKSHNVGVAIDKAAGVPARGKAFNMKGRGERAEELDANGREFLPPYEPATPAAREWQGWGTSAKPAWEPICIARKPLAVDGRPATVAANVLAHGVGALNIAGCRVAAVDKTPAPVGQYGGSTIGPAGHNGHRDGSADNLGRWPANIVHDGSDEVVGLFPDVHGAGAARAGQFGGEYDATSYDMGGAREMGRFGDTGSAARFFYTAKADKEDRLGSRHPTVKPVDLMQWLIRLVTPRGGLCLDPFAGTGTTGEAAWREGMRCILIEREAEYQADIARRMSLADAGPDARLHGRLKAAGKVEAANSLPLFAEAAE